MDATAITLLASVMTTTIGAAIGWFAHGKQRQIQAEGGALELYHDALAVLESVQSEVTRMSGDREEMRVQLEECVRARNDAALERAKDRVKIAQLEQGAIEGQQKIAHLEEELSKLTPRTGVRI